MLNKCKTNKEKVISRILVGFAYYQPQDDIKIPYALFSLRPDIGRRLKNMQI